MSSSDQSKDSGPKSESDSPKDQAVPTPGEELEATLPLGAKSQVGSGTQGQVTANPDGEETLPPSQPTPVPAKAVGAAAKPGAASKSSEVAGKTFAKRFVLEELLGEGGMGRVYLARDQFVDGRAVALKVLHPKYSKHETFRSLFFREIKTAQKFVSENVNQVRDTGQTDDGTLFLTMDLVDGEDLDGLLKRESQVNVRHALDITIQILMGLQSGHEHGFVHRDVKPSNVMLANRITKGEENPFGVGVRLLDFGIAGLAADMEEGQMVGTPNYMSPEQVQGQRLDARSDLFAVGVVLFEMITGTRPFQGKTIAQITSSILEKDMAPMIRDISDLSKPIQAILSKALEKNRDKRFQSAEEFITAIRKSSAYRLPSLMPAWAGASLVLLTLGCAATGFFLWDTLQKNERLDSDLQAARIGGVREDASLNEKHRQELSARDQLLSDRDALISERDGKIASLQTTIQELTSAQQAKVDTKQDTTVDVNKFQARIDDLEAAVASLERERENFQRDLALEDSKHLAAVQAFNSQINKLETQLKEYDDFKTQNRPDALISEAFDSKLHSFWQARKGSMARQSLGTLQSNSTVGTIAGGGVLQAITSLTEQLERFAGNPGDSPQQRGQRSEAIAALEQLVPQLEDLSDFERQANQWLRFGEKDATAGQSSARFLAISELLMGPEGLLAEARGAVASLNQRRDERWAAIQSGAALQSPSAVQALAKEHQDEGYLERELTRFVSGLRQELVDAGALDHQRLIELNSLEEWSRLVASSSELGQTAERADLALFQFAKRWFADADFVGQPQDAKLFGKNPLGGELDWQTALYLAHQMTLAGSAFPVPENGRLTYRLARSDEPEVTWRTHTHSSRVSGVEEATWEVDLLSHKQNGRESFGRGSFDYLRKGKLFMRQNKEVFNLDGSRRPEVQSVLLAPQPAPPIQVVKGYEMDEFEADVNGQAILCLYQKDAAGVERWISPRYGLVRERDNRKGKVIDLVFGSYAR